MKKIKIILSLALICFAAGRNIFAEGADTNSPAWISQPLSLVQCLNLAFQQNASILKAKNDLEAAHGVVVQTRAVALPHLTATGQYKYTDPKAIETFPSSPGSPNQNWNAGVQIVQSIYEGGKTSAALKPASATKQKSLAQYPSSVEEQVAGVRRPL